MEPEDRAGDRSYFSYSAIPGWSFPAGILGIMLVAGLALLVESFRSGGPWPFVLLWLGGVGAMGYGFLHERAYVVRLIDGTLTWHGFLYDGSRAVSDVKSVHTGSAGTYVWTFADGEQMKMAFWTNGWSGRPMRIERFLHEVGQAYPQIQLPG